VYDESRLLEQQSTRAAPWHESCCSPPPAAPVGQRDPCPVRLASVNPYSRHHLRRHCLPRLHSGELVNDREPKVDAEPPQHFAQRFLERVSVFCRPVEGNLDVA
jgi:hypothetical protein